MTGAEADVAPEELLTLQEAAGRLKVHYMTAYRWVRRGELPAFKAGGRLRVRAADVDEFITSRQVDVALPATGARRTDWPTHVARLTAALLEGRATDANALVRKVVTDGAPAGDIYISLLTPALHAVGEEWAAGRVGISIEHRATEITNALMVRLGELFRRRGAGRGVAVTLTPAGDRHGLAIAMVADFLRAAGYDVHHLGANVPADALASFLETVPADVVALSVTVGDLEPGVLAETVAAARGAGGRIVTIGGQGTNPQLAEAVGAAYVGSLTDLAERLDALTAPAPG